jgi:hypothetical protein
MACRGCSSGDGCDCSVVSNGDGVITVSGSGSPIVDPYIPEFHGDVWLDGLPDETDPCDILNDPMVPVIFGDGSVAKVPLPCPSDFLANTPVPGNAFAFTFSATTTDADPGDGTLRLNNADVTLVTRIYVDLAEFLGSDITDWLDSLGNTPAEVRLYKRSDPAVWADFTLDGVILATGYRKIMVTYVDHEGAFTTDPGDIALDISRNGIDGADAEWNTPQVIEAVTGTYTLDIDDAGKYLRSTSASGYTITVPTNASVAFPVGIHVDIIQAGAGQVTIAGDVGVTVNCTPGNKTAIQWGAVTLIKVGTDEWDLIGNLAA